MKKTLYYITTNGLDLLATDDGLGTDESVRLIVVAPAVSAEDIHEWRSQERWLGDPMPESLYEYLKAVYDDWDWEITDATISDLAGLDRDGERDCNAPYICGAIEVDF